MSIQQSEGGKKLDVRDATELAAFYGVPKSLMNAMFVEIGGVAYPKAPALLYLGQKKGIQRIEVTKPVLDAEGEWRCEARIYPALGLQKLQEINRLPPDMKGRAFDYLTAPTVEWGHASAKNVRMSTMQQYLPEMAIKRAYCRALRIFAGSFGTSFEEMPEAELQPEELKVIDAKVVEVQGKIA